MNELPVFLVDDADPIRRGIAVLLRKTGYEVQEFADGASAVAAIREGRRLRLLVTDVVLPGAINGVDVAAAARAAIPELPIVFMSGHARDQLAEIGALLDDQRCVYLTKPFAFPTLLATVRALCGAAASR